MGRRNSELQERGGWLFLGWLCVGGFSALEAPPQGPEQTETFGTNRHHHHQGSPTPSRD